MPPLTGGTLLDQPLMSWRLGAIDYSIELVSTDAD
jgi:hypothetical protein